jgi:hypothetical protein
MSAREQVAQGGPPTSLAGFPTRTLGTGTALYRAHQADRGPWWFGSDGSGRFDLPAPRGSCYLALDPASALRERVGPVLAAARAVPESLLEDVVVSRLALPSSREVADLQSRAAGEYGVTRELETMVPYVVPQSWARALDHAGHHGVGYGPRFTPGDCSAVAVFDEAGERDWPVDPAPVPAPAVPGGPAVVPTPRRSDLTVVRPPRTRVPRS